MKKAPDARLDMAAYLHSTACFCGIRDQSMTKLAAACRRKRFRKGESIFFQSDPAEAAFIVYSGAVAIVLCSLDGRELVINELRAGEFFGELSLIIGQPRSTSAVARKDTELIVVPRQAFLAALDAEPWMARHLLEVIAQRLYSSSERESALAFLDAEGRLARVLLQMDKQAEKRGYVTASQEELAQRAGLTRQTVAKALGRWRRSGWLITGRGHIMLLQHQALEDLGREFID